MDNVPRYPLILLVDDDSMTRNTVERLLRPAFESKVDILVYEDGPQLFQDLEKIKSYQRIMLMCDATMPHMMGHEVVRKLRLELVAQLKKCVFMSGLFEKHRKSVIGLDVIPLHRPFSIHEVNALVHDFLADR